MMRAILDTSVLIAQGVDPVFDAFIPEEAVEPVEVDLRLGRPDLQVKYQLSAST